MSGLGMLTRFGLTPRSATPSGDLEFISATKAGPNAFGPFSLARPPGVSPGDTLILIVGRRFDSTTPIADGWTLLGSVTYGTARSWVYQRTVAASEPDSYTIAAGGWKAAVVIAIRGVTSVELAPLSSTRVAPSMLAESLPAILIGGWVNAADSTPPAWLPPAGMTLAADTGANANVQVSVAYAALESTGETGARTPASGSPGGAYATWSLLAYG